jgi:hypothetical protein
MPTTQAEKRDRMSNTQEKRVAVITGASRSMFTTGEILHVDGGQSAGH